MVTRAQAVAQTSAAESEASVRAAAAHRHAIRMFPTRPYTQVAAAAGTDKHVLPLGLPRLAPRWRGAALGAHLARGAGSEPVDGDGGVVRAPRRRPVAGPRVRHLRGTRAFTCCSRAASGSQGARDSTGPVSAADNRIWAPRPIARRLGRGARVRMPGACAPAT